MKVAFFVWSFGFINSSFMKPATDSAGWTGYDWAPNWEHLLAKRWTRTARRVEKREFSKLQ